MQAELLSQPINFAIVQLPERQFPGVVVQGDTLHALTQRVEEMNEALRRGDLQELSDLIADVSEQLSGAKEHYERVCTERGLSLPY